MTISNNSFALPRHVGIIMDGNRRWAKNHHLPTATGHAKGAETFKKIALYCNKIGMKHLTVYAFSTENWNRSQSEISALMLLFKRYIDDVLNKFEKENIRIRFIGDKSKFSTDIQQGIEKVETRTKNYTGLNLNIAMNYGSRAEIVRASRSIAEKILNGDISEDDITEEIFSENLYTVGIPDLDLIIRTAGEQRLSNFFLWQSAYAEFYFSDVLWPDFDESEFQKAVREYSTRTRKFGGQ